MEEENKTESAVGMSETDLIAGKFKNVEALVRAYGELESEFTRRSQRLRALEEELASREKDEAPHAPRGQEELLRAVTEDEGLKARILGDYLQELRSVPLMAGAGSGVIAEVKRPKTVAEAGDLALGYLKRQKQS